MTGGAWRAHITWIGARHSRSITVRTCACWSFRGPRRLEPYCKVAGRPQVSLWRFTANQWETCGPRQCGGLTATGTWRVAQKQPPAVFMQDAAGFERCAELAGCLPGRRRKNINLLWGPPQRHPRGSVAGALFSARPGRELYEYVAQRGRPSRHHFGVHARPEPSSKSGLCSTNRRTVLACRAPA